MTAAEDDPDREHDSQATKAPAPAAETPTGLQKAAAGVATRRPGRGDREQERGPAWPSSSATNSPTAGSGKRGLPAAIGEGVTRIFLRSPGGLHHAVEGQERLNGELHVDVQTDLRA